MLAPRHTPCADDLSDSRPGRWRGSSNPTSHVRFSFMLLTSRPPSSTCPPHPLPTHHQNDCAKTDLITSLPRPCTPEKGHRWSPGDGSHGRKRSPRLHCGVTSPSHCPPTSSLHCCPSCSGCALTQASLSPAVQPSLAVVPKSGTTISQSPLHLQGSSTQSGKAGANATL